MIQNVVIVALVAQELDMEWEDVFANIANIFLSCLFFAFGIVIIFGGCAIAVGVFCFILNWFGLCLE